MVNAISLWKISRRLPLTDLSPISDEQTMVSNSVPERSPQFFFLRFRFVLQPPNFDRQLFLERLGFVRTSGILGLADLVLQKQFSLGNPSFEHRINFSDLLLLLVRQQVAWRLLLEPFHRQFVSR